MLDLDQRLTLLLNGSSSLFWDNMMYTVTGTASWTLLLAVLLYVLFKNRSVRDAFIIILAIAVLIALTDRICSGIVKPAVARWRPTRDPSIMYLVDTVRDYRGGAYGFFSGHASNTFAVATFLALLFRSRVLTPLLFFWAATTTYTRLYLGVHYLGDVTVGALVGLAMGTLVYIVYDRVNARIGRPHLISGQFTDTGFLRADLSLFACVMFVNYLLLTIVATAQGIE